MRDGESRGKAPGGWGDIWDDGPHTGDRGRDEGGHGRHRRELREESDLCTHRAHLP